MTVFLYRAQVDKQNRYLLRLQQDFRRAADMATYALMNLEDVEAIAVVGSVAKSLWKEEVLRFSEFRRAGWNSGMMAKTAIWRNGFHPGTGLVHWVCQICRCTRALRAERVQVPPIIKLQSFLIEQEPIGICGGSADFNAGPKHNPKCRVPACGAAEAWLSEVTESCPA